MKRIIYISVILFSLLLTSSSFKHPIKLTSSQIKYDSKAKTIGMECNVFLDDFAPAISPTLFENVTTSNVTEKDKKQIEEYFIAKYKIKINGKTLPLKFEEFNYKNNVMRITFSKNKIALKKGDRLYIENELLFEHFFELQSNWITIRIPPFLSNYNFESKFDNYAYSKTL